MTNSPTDKELQVEPTREKLVYVVQDNAFNAENVNEISLRDVWDILWRGKWIIVAVTAIFSVGSIIYALAATEWYRAEVLLVPAEAKSTPSLGGQLSGLAALAGVSVGGGETAEAIATLNSRELARDFIETKDLMRVILHDAWDESLQTWRTNDQSEIPDIRDAITVFHEQVLRVRRDRESELVTVAMEWTDPGLAAAWAKEFVHFSNERLRRRALEQAEANVAYLQGELVATGVVTLQQSIGRLLEAELQKLMLARGNEEFAFRTVDGAEIPKKRFRPRRTLMVMIGTLLGGMLSVMVVFIRHAFRSPQRRQQH